MGSKAKTTLLLAIAGVASLVTAPAVAREPSLRTSYAATTGTTSVPFGWVDFCDRYSGECDGPALPAEDIDLTAKTLKTIERINHSVNHTIVPETDMEHWGVVDRWDYPLDGKGDCEDYALLKRKMLMEAGLPRQALLMTVVKDHAGEGHAILTVKTNRGEFALDNMVDTVLAWDDTGYRFVKRQSQEDPNVWKSIGPAVAAPLFTAR